VRKCWWNCFFLFFTWNVKIIFAVVTDCIRPFGLRRKPWMCSGWSGVLILLLTLAIGADKLTASTWLSLQLITQVFLMFIDVPADGYSVELGQLETKEQRGQILATGHRVFASCLGSSRRSFSMVHPLAPVIVPSTFKIPGLGV